MVETMGTFRVDIEIERPAQIGRRAELLEGLNLRVEPVAKRLVDAGPAPATAVA